MSPMLKMYRQFTTIGLIHLVSDIVHKSNVVSTHYWKYAYSGGSTHHLLEGMQGVRSIGSTLSKGS